MNDEAAFPLNTDDGSTTGHLNLQRGMSLRHFFAAAALKGMLSSLSTKFARGNLAEEQALRGDGARRLERTIARACYDYADAMLAQGLSDAPQAPPVPL